ncbi:uncharacterized protein N7529_006752 [Penicillium soppii]|uniref:uncharacterized protein n=1 Tax=Penicillium soppii TaxID=69789 RepID=UPI0025485BE9|nr:uncharacterized protein N7529_006752 [Penicillium soppii]KAJ5864836.1 hypothetical protein N7529_006752 [Penicillium soppii]
MAVHARSISALGSVAVALLLAVDTTALQLFNATPSGIPSACGDALVTNITCDQLYSVSAVSNQQFIGSKTLEAICVSNCRDSLYDYHDQVESACGTEVYDFAGVNQTVQNFLDPLTWAFNVSCLTNGDEYCYSDITNRNTSIEPCSDCFLQYEAAMLGSASPTSLSATSSPTTTCTGTTYTVKQGDSCDTIAAAHDVATGKFITENHFDANCTAMSVGDDVCIGTSCSLYQVQPGDTCSSILANYTFYMNQLLSWNPTIHTNCDNLDTMVGDQICVGPPGEEDWNVTTTNFTTVWNVTFVLPTTAFTTLPAQTGAPNYTTSWFVTTSTISNYTQTATALSSSVVSSYNDLTTYCPISFNDAMSGWDITSLPDDCYAGLLKYCEPSLNATMPASTKFPNTCSPAYYQATASSTTATSTKSSPPTQSGIANNCDALYVVKTNDTCASIVKVYGNFTLTQFYTWNPAVGTSCKYLDAGDAVCVGVPSTSATPTSSGATSTATSTKPSPVMPSTAADCTKYYYVVENDSCESIETAHDITAAEFSKWNPYVSNGTDCQHLWLDTYVCVDAPDSSSSTATTSIANTATQTVTSTSTIPSPVMPSTVADCTKYHYVVTDDTCESIEGANDITAAQFSTWNPYVADGTDCQNLWLDTYVCVDAPDQSSATTASVTTTTHTASSTTPSPLIPSTDADCAKFHYVVADEDCESIESEYSITAAQFNTWNPYVGSDCAGLWLNYYVCVGV